MANPQVYLAGPEVFLPNPLSVGAAKIELCSQYGFDGKFPLHTSLHLGLPSTEERAYAISAANETLIRGCQLLIANMTPFRGPSMDVGTAFEMGFARALGMALFGYTNAPGNFQERTVSFLRGAVHKRLDGGLEDSNSMLIEGYNLLDNLMLDGALYANGTEVFFNPSSRETLFTDLRGFERCLQAAAQQFKTTVTR